MISFESISVLSLVKTVGEERVKRILSSFSCPLNAEIESYLLNNAIEFARRKMSVTYLVLDDDGRLVAYYTLSHKPALIPATSLSNTQKKKLERYARLDADSNVYNVSAFLIAQFGKNYKYCNTSDFTGFDLMDLAIKTLIEAQELVGGGVIFLECENKLALLNFYKNESNNFVEYGERISGTDKTTYKQLLRFF